MPALAWTQRTGASRSVTTTGAVTDTFDTTAANFASNGMSLDDVYSFMVDVQADASQTITGAGILQAFVWNPYSRLWSRCPKLDISGTLTGVRGEAFSGFYSPGGGSRIGYQPSGFTVSSGSITINVTAFVVNRDNDTVLA